VFGGKPDWFVYAQMSLHRPLPSAGDGTMLRKTSYATLIVILMMGAAFAQQGTYIQGMPGYSSDRSDAEKKNDKDIDRAYQSTIKGRRDAEKKSDPWADIRPAPPAAAAKNKQ